MCKRFNEKTVRVNEVENTIRAVKSEAELESILRSKTVEVIGFSEVGGRTSEMLLAYAMDSNTKYFLNKELSDSILTRVHKDHSGIGWTRGMTVEDYLLGQVFVKANTYKQWTTVTMYYSMRHHVSDALKSSEIKRLINDEILVCRDGE